MCITWLCQLYNDVHNVTRATNATQGVFRLHILISGTQLNSCCANTDMPRTLDARVNFCSNRQPRPIEVRIRLHDMTSHHTIGAVNALETLPESTSAAWYCSDSQWRSARRLWCSQCPPYAPSRAGSPSPNSLCSSACCRARAPDALWNPWISDPCGRASRKTLGSHRCWNKNATITH